MRDRSLWQTRAAVVLGLVALTLSFPASGETFKERLNRFKLFAECRPMILIVEGLSSHAAEIGLTEESNRAAAESRLRTARLFSPESEQYLYINVKVFSAAFSLSMQYDKTVYDPLSDLRFPAPTWGRSSTGTHGGQSNYILSILSNTLDQFLVEFLRVNEEACATR